MLLDYLLGGAVSIGIGFIWSTPCSVRSASRGLL